MRIAVWIIAAVVAVLGLYVIYDAWLPHGDGRLVVLSDPPGAQIWVDLSATDYITDGRAIPLSPGPHSVMVKLDTLESDPFAIPVEIRWGRCDTIKFLLRPPDTAVAIPRKKLRAPIAEPKPPITETPSTPADDDLRRTTKRNADLMPDIRTEYQEPLAAERSAIENEPPPNPRKTESGTGLVEISSSLLDAKIIINAQPWNDVTPATLTLPAGDYVIRVELPGYQSKPPEAVIKVSAGTARQFVFFDLIEQDTVDKTITIETEPVAGKIFVDSVEVGEGRVTVERDYGVYNITVGPMDGYFTPPAQRVIITPSNKTPVLKITYPRSVIFSAEVRADNTVLTEGDLSWETGIYFDDGGAQRTAAMGAKIREIPGSQKHGWEIGVGDAGRNPAGGDYVEFFFTVPGDVATATMKMRLYLYRSPRKYPLVLSGNSEIFATVNGKNYLNGYRPTPTTDTADLEHVEEFSIGSLLVSGKNRIMIRAGAANTLYHYLWKIEIR